MQLHTKRITIYAVLISLAITLNFFERIIPGFVFWVKPGFANIIIIIVIKLYGIRSAIIVSIMRTILTSIILGTFLSLQFYLSFFGGLVSAIIMGFLFYFKIFKNNIIPVSIIGAITNNIVQILIVFKYMITLNELLYQLPFMLVISTIAGTLNGYISQITLRRIKCIE